MTQRTLARFLTPAIGRPASPKPRVGSSRARPVLEALEDRVLLSTLLVDDDRAQFRNAPFTTISAAVAAASPGDTIKVAPGLYQESVLVNKTLTLLGARAD